MRITDLLEENCVVADLKARAKKGAIEELAASLAHSHPKIPLGKLVSALLEREKIESTGIGGGIAIPHGKLKAIDRVYGAFGRSPAGVEFEAKDAKPCHLLFLLVAPEDAAEMHLLALQKVARVLKDTSVRKQILDARDGAEIYRILKREGEKS